MIEIQELYKYYGDRRAVGPLSTQVKKGEIVGLLGLNGSGKTTTLRVLACDLMPTSGSVKVGGHDVVGDSDAVRARVGYLPDRPPLYDEMTVREYVRFAARLRRVPKANLARAVDEAIELTELGDVVDQIIGTLSHGFKQRVGIAQAIVHGPDLVVLDEPISGLDPVQIVEMRELVRGLGGARTVIVSSHILSEISETCDRILVIDQGRIAWGGSEAELSSELGQGMRFDVTVRGTDEAKLRSALALVSGLESIELGEPSEPGEGIVTVRIASQGDPRDAVLRALVGANLSVLELVRRHELESMVIRLLGGDEEAARRRGKKRREAEPAKDQPKSPEPGPSGESEAG